MAQRLSAVKVRKRVAEDDPFDRTVQPKVDAAVANIKSVCDALLTKHRIKNARLTETPTVSDSGVDITYEVAVAPHAPAAVINFMFRPKQGWGWLLKPTIQEILVVYCNQRFAMLGLPNVELLLWSIGVLQNADQIRPISKRTSLPANPANSSDALDWAKEVAQEIYSRHPDINLESIQELIEAATEDAKQNNISEQELKRFLAVLRVAGNKKWKAAIKKDLPDITNSKYKFTSSLPTIQKSIETLTNGKYKGKLVPVYNDSGELVVLVNAPYKLLFVFTRLTGGKLELHDLTSEVCLSTHSYLGKNLAGVKALIKAVLTFGTAAKNAELGGEKEDEAAKHKLSEETKQEIEDALEKIGDQIQTKFLLDIRKAVFKLTKIQASKSVSFSLRRFTAIPTTPIKNFLKMVEAIFADTGEYLDEKDLKKLSAILLSEVGEPEKQAQLQTFVTQFFTENPPTKRSAPRKKKPK